MDARADTPALSATLKHIKRQRTRKLMALLAAVVAAIGLAVVLFAPDPLRVESAVIAQGPLQVTVSNQGYVRAHDKYVIAAPVAAGVERIDLHEGDAVTKGQTVASLRPLPLDARQRDEAIAKVKAAQALAREAELRTGRAETDLRLAASERRRVEELVRNGFMSVQTSEKAVALEQAALVEWDAARSRRQAALAEVKAAQAVLSALRAANSGATVGKIQLTSPVSGYAIKVHEQSERTVAAGVPLMTVNDPTRYEIVVDVLSTDAVKMSPGNLMLIDNWGGEKLLSARVRLIEPVAPTKVSVLGVEEQRVNVIADPVEELGALGDGYRVEARIVIWSDENVLKAPGSSVFRVGDAWHVFALENGRLREKAIKIGRRNQDEVHILSGLAPGAVVVRFPSNEMQDGMRAQVLNDRS
jgi:HlyD family secretion protein